MIKITIFIIITVIITTIIGSAISLFARYKNTILFNMIIGFVFSIAFFEILALPFLLLKSNFNSLLYTYLAIMLGIMVVSIYLIVKKQAKFNFKIDVSSFMNLAWVIFYLLFFLQLVVLVLFAHNDGDDAFYVGVINTILSSGKIFSFEPSVGLAEFSYPTTYSIVGYEVMIACWSKIFHISPIIMCHTVLPIIYLFFSYGVYYYLGKLFLSERKVAFYMIFIALFNLFSNNSPYFSGAFLLLRGWQGKGLLVNILFPLLIYFYVSMIENTSKDKFANNGLMIVMILVAGTCLSTVGFYLLPVAYFCLVIANFVYKKDILLFFKSCIIAIPSFLLLIVMLLSMLSDRSSLGILLEIEYNYNYWQELMKFFNHNIYWLVLYIFSIICVWLRGKRKERLVFCVYPFVLFCTFLNPLFFPFVAKYLTGAPVYWRFFWLLPIYVTVAIGIIQMWSIRKKTVKFLLLVLIVSVIIPSNFIVNRVNYVLSENPEKIEQTAIDFSNRMLVENEIPVALSVPEYQSIIRQYSGEIINCWPRRSYVFENYQRVGKMDAFYRLERVYQILYEGRDEKLSVEDFSEFGINTLIVEIDKNNLVPDEFLLIDEDHNLGLFVLKN